jgi:hypothetical protein
VITTLGFTTRDRPEYLGRCVDTFIRSCRSFGRTPRLLIMDDALPGGHASARPVAERVARQHPDLDVGYAGAPEKRAFIDSLVEKGLPPDVIEFALADPERCGYTLGANRNALQLATVGEQVMYIDDDCLAVTARPPAWRDELAVLGHGSSQDYWYFADHESALAAATFTDVDLLAVHEEYLGRHCGEVIADATLPGGTDRLAGFAAFMQRHSRVRVTQNGVVGDSCMFSNLGHLLHGGRAGRDRLVHSAEVLETAMTSREIIRSPAHPTLRLGGTLIGPDYSCDQSTTVPPYFPVFRSSDTTFAALLSASEPSAAFADVPWLIVHDSLPGRRYSNRGTSERWRASVGEVIRGLLTTEAPGAYHSISNPLASIGSRLEGFGSLPAVDFDELVKDVITAAVAVKVDRLERLLADYAPAPAHYAGAVGRSLTLLRASESDPRRHVPVELRGTQDDERAVTGAIARLQRLTRSFGRLMASWKEINEATVVLVTHGVVPAPALARQPTRATAVATIRSRT